MKSKEVKEIKGYKGFDRNLQCRGFQYEVGKTYTKNGRIKICKNGFHFCKELYEVNKFYPLTESRVCEVVGSGVIVHGKDKIVAEKIEILRELSKEEVLNITNIGIKNKGLFNTGNRNSGWRNTGNGNTGSFNTGNSNFGWDNTGSSNFGWRNTGDLNFGKYNTGDRNSGEYNAGNSNYGCRNTGNGNTGWYNTGDFNKTSYCVGAFNTISPKITVFNKKISKMLYERFKNHSGFYVLKNFYISHYSIRRKGKRRQKESYSYKESWAIFWSTLSLRQRYFVYQLPFLDKKVFFEITGIKLHEGICEKKRTRNEGER